MLHATSRGVRQGSGERCIGSRPPECPPLHLSATTDEDHRRTGFETTKLVPDLLDLFGRPPRPAFTATSSDQDVLHRLAECVIKATGPSFPARLSLRVRGFHVRQAAL